MPIGVWIWMAAVLFFLTVTVVLLIDAGRMLGGKHGWIRHRRKERE